MQYLVELPNPDYNIDEFRVVENNNRYKFKPRLLYDTPRTMQLPIADQKHWGSQSPMVFYSYPKYGLNSVAAWERHLNQVKSAVVECGPITLQVSRFFEKARAVRMPPNKLKLHLYLQHQPSMLYRYDNDGYLFHKLDDEK